VNARVTLADVSKAAGVGIATVSRALAAEPHPDVSPGTRERIREVADRLGYRPSVTARALRSGGYHALSIVVPDYEWGWWEPAVRSAFQAADMRDHHVIVHPIAGREGGATSVIDSLASIPTDGLLIFGSAGDPAVRDAAHRLRLPVVAIDDVSRSVLLPTICADSRSGAAEAVGHLLATGRRRIAYIGSDGAAAFAEERLRGYHDAHESAGVQADPALMISCRNAVDESLLTFPEVDRLLDERPDIDAIFCEFDLMAAAVYRSLRSAGKRIPEDVAVMGFDDERAAQLLDPPLSTMRQPYQDMGASAVELLLRAIGGESLPVERRLVRTTLVLRQSA
jgi:LacI family transcriptional regulator